MAKTFSNVVFAPQPTVSSTCRINSTTISHCPFKIRCIVPVLSNDLDHSHASEAYRINSFQNSPSSLVANGFQRDNYVAISAANCCCCSRGCLSRTRWKYSPSNTSRSAADRAHHTRIRGLGSSIHNVHITSMGKSVILNTQRLLVIHTIHRSVSNTSLQVYTTFSMSLTFTMNVTTL